jgi:hypothetical protein
LTGTHGPAVRATSSFGYASTFRVERPGRVTVSFVGSFGHGLEIALETVAWIVVAAALAGRARWLDWWWGPFGRGAKRRRRGRATSTTVVSEPPVETSAEQPDSMSPVVT